MHQVPVPLRGVHQKRHLQGVRRKPEQNRENEEDLRQDRTSTKAKSKALTKEPLYLVAKAEEAGYIS